jgi:hypothetical protein
MYVHRGERVAHHLKRAWSSRAGAGVEVHTLDDLNRVVEQASWRADVGSSPREAGSTGAGSLRLRACGHIERDVSA